jgi:hypothetical protein
MARARTDGQASTLVVVAFFLKKKSIAVANQCRVCLGRDIAASLLRSQAKGLTGTGVQDATGEGDAPTLPCPELLSKTRPDHPLSSTWQHDDPRQHMGGGPSSKQNVC